MQAARRRLVWACIFVLAIGNAAAAQDVITIAGTVTTRADGLSVPGATVSVLGTTITATTDTSGRYALKVPRSVARGARIQIKVDAPGLPSKVTDVAVSSPALTVDVALTLAFAEQVTVGSRAAGAEAREGRAGRRHHAGPDCRDRLRGDGAGDPGARTVVQLPAADDHRRHGHGAPRDAARARTRPGARARQRQAPPSERARAPERQHRPRVDRRRPERDPGSAIERIEVLRDGAAAQYGSDAIAGVINIVLKGGVSRPAVTSKFGLSKGSFAGNSCEPSGLACTAGDDIDFSDGGLFDAGGSWGLAAGKGTVTVAAEYRHHNRTNRASFDPRDQVVAGDAGNNAVAEPNHRWGDPDTRDVMTFLNANVPLNSAADAVSLRLRRLQPQDGEQRGLLSPCARRAELAADLSARLPAGHRAHRGRCFRHRRRPRRLQQMDLRRERRIRAQQLRLYDRRHAQRVARTVRCRRTRRSSTPALSSSINSSATSTSAGRSLSPASQGRSTSHSAREYRRENYQIHAGEPDSYGDGGLAEPVRRPGGDRSPGVSWIPSVERGGRVAQQRRGYVDVEGDVIKWLRLGLAGRAEHYDDFGGTLDGKLTVRVQPDPRFVIRGLDRARGFRAPSLGQSFFSSTATNFVNLGQGLVPVESLTLPVSSAPAQVLGAQPLKPENSLHTSGGVVITPLPGLDVAIDYYRIAIDDRIVLSGNFTAAPIAALLAPFGANSARFFTNAIDTRTNGVDVTANYRIAAGHGRRRAAARRLQQHATEDRRVRRHASAAGRIRVGPVRSDRAASDRVRAAEGQPASGRRLASQPAWRQSRRSPVRRVLQLHAEPGRRSDLRAKWLTDVEASYRVGGYTLAAGVAEPLRRLPGPQHDRQLVQRHPDVPEPVAVRHERPDAVRPHRMDVLVSDSVESCVTPEADSHQLSAFSSRPGFKLTADS